MADAATPAMLWFILVILFWWIYPALIRIAKAIEALSPPAEEIKPVTENDVAKAIAEFYESKKEIASPSK